MNNAAESRLHCEFIKQSCEVVYRTTHGISGRVERPPQKNFLRGDVNTSVN